MTTMFLLSCETCRMCLGDNLSLKQCTLEYQISDQVAYSFAKFWSLVLLLDTGRLLLLILAYFGSPVLLKYTMNIAIKLFI